MLSSAQNLRVSSLDLTQSLAAQLKSYRLRGDLTQKELAALVGVSVRTVQGWEAGTFPQPRHRRALRGLLLNGAAEAVA